MRKQHPAYVGLAILFVVSFVVLHWIYGYVIAFQSETNDCFFMFGRPFLLEFLDHPAGALRYAGRFLGQFYHYPWLGALIVSACIACFGVLFHRLLAKLKSRVRVCETLFPCLLLLALHTSPICLLHDTLGLVASCAAFLGYLSFRKKAARRVYALVATPIVYLLLGGYAWFFVAWIVAFEWLDGPLRTGLPFKVAYILFSVAVPLVAWRWVFLIPLRSALTWPLSIIPPLRAGVLYYSVLQFVADCLLAVVLSAWVVLIPFWKRSSSGSRPAALRPSKARGWNRVVLRVVLPVVLAVLAVVLHVIRYDASLSSMIACRRLYQQGRWDALLAEVKGRTFLDLDSQLMTNFALYKKGKLLDEMFHYPQVWGSRGLISNLAGRVGLSPAEDDRYRAMYNCDLFYEMGHINLAFRHAYNNMNAMGATNGSLKRMAKCSMANGNYEMADKYLTMLERTLFGKAFARRYKAIIADPDAAEREFGELRKRYPVAQVAVWQHPVMHLVALPVDEDHSMAFDYLTAWLLLEKTKGSLATVCDNIEAFKKAGYVSIPTHCQEMLLLWERQEGTRVDLRGYLYDEAIAARTDQFLRDLARDRDREDAARRLRARYGDTYMFYCFCVPTPAEVRQFLPTPGRSGVVPREE